MSKLLLGRNLNTGGMKIVEHYSCFAPIGSLYSGLSKNESYCRKLYISTNWNKQEAQLYMKAFRESFRGKVRVRRRLSPSTFITITASLPTFRYYDAKEGLPSSSPEFSDAVLKNNQRGYFVINLPSDLKENEVYVWVKLFGKSVSLPNVGGAGAAFRKAYQEFKCWRKAATVLGLAGYTLGYSFPLSGSAHVSYNKDLLLSWINGGVHEATTPYINTVSPKFGKPISSSVEEHHRKVYTDMQVMPNLRATGTSVPNYRFTQEPKDRYLSKTEIAINQVKNLLGAE